MFYWFSIVYILLQVCSSYCSEVPLGWTYINLHCRDNDNKPVDWWYLYKPPFGSGPNMELGSNFSFITPGKSRWVPSNKYINGNSMLQNTLSPLFRPTYSHYLAVIVYSNRRDNVTKGTSAHGLMMADELGGVWIGHTVPGLIDLKADRPSFPTAEIDKGHLIMCLSLDLPTLNLLAASIREAGPKVLRMKVPQSVRHLLPNWKYFNVRVKPNARSLPARPVAFTTTDNTLRAMILVRRPGEKQCMYRTFAKSRRIVLDVYGHDRRAQHGCEKNSGLRKIESISLKYPESVYYIDNKTDSSNFAVSTAAHWQKKGDGPRQYWACVSSVEREDSTGRGGLALCVEDYAVWWNFDNMKTKEPKC